MPRYGRSAGYPKPQSQRYVCTKTKCRHYKKGIEEWKRNKYTGCHRYINTWQCPKWMAKDYYK